MPDAFSRWCVFCDAEIHSGARGNPRVRFENYVEDIIVRSRRGEAFRLYDRENRVMRIADAHIIRLPSGSAGLAAVLTLGDRRSAHPSFLHFRRGTARDPEKEDDEVPGRSAHLIIELTEHPDYQGRHRMLLEDVASIGRTPVTRLLCSELREISTGRDERFRSPDTGGMIQLRPVMEIWPQQSRQMQDALERGRLGVVELYDFGRIPAFDEHPEFRVKRRVLRVEVEPARDGFAGALERLRGIGFREGYRNMRLNWRLPDGQVAHADMRTDVEDVGTALLARRELVTVERQMSTATHRLNDEFVEAMASHFV